MSWMEILLLGVALAMDAFAVSIAAAAGPLLGRKREGAPLVLLFAVFQGGMTVLGWAVGVPIAELISTLDHWIAFGLLVFVGVRMIRAGIWPGSHPPPDPRRWRTRLTLAVATSIDAFAVGLGLALLDRPVASAALGIGLTTLVFSSVGILIGRGLGRHFGDRMQVLGGTVLLLIGLQILYEHMVAAA